MSYDPNTQARAMSLGTASSQGTALSASSQRVLRNTYALLGLTLAFSAGVVESLIVTDRWLFLKQHADLVEECWVEPVFDFRESPRNLVVVGMKKGDS